MNLKKQIRRKRRVWDSDAQIWLPPQPKRKLKDLPQPVQELLSILILPHLAQCYKAGMPTSGPEKNLENLEWLINEGWVRLCTADITHPPYVPDKFSTFLQCWHGPSGRYMNVRDPRLME